MLFAFAALNTEAAVLIVKEYGVNATYSSISAAITAAANNDTIVVYDKPSGQPWLESLTIDKNLTFLNGIQGGRIKAPGTVTIVPKAGMDLYFIGWDMNGQNLGVSATGATATSSNRAKITVTDCINVADINLNQDWIDARLFYNQSNVTGTFIFRHGLAVANVLANGGIQIEQESTNAAENDSIIIVGNKAKWCYVDTREAGIVANNYFNNSVSSFGFVPGSSGLVLKGHNSAASAVFGIYNNTILNSIGGTVTASGSPFYTANTQQIFVNTRIAHGLNPGNTITMSGWNVSNVNGTFSGITVTSPTTFSYLTSCSGSTCGNLTYTGGTLTSSSTPSFVASICFNNTTLSNVEIVNNLCYSTTSNVPLYGIFASSTTGQPFISHNYINAVAAPAGNICTISFNNELNYTSTTANAYGTIDTWGRAASGNTNLINKGNYLGQYFDVDLTRNDIGTYGGPYTIDNYINGNTSKARVLYLNIKRQLTNLNQILNVKGSAGSRF